MIELRNIKKEYKIKGQKVQALDSINLTLPNKGMVSILGTSGSGKSTLLNIMGGLDSYDSGEMFVDGKSTKNFHSKEYTRYRNSYVGFIFQEFYLIEECTVYENIHLVARLEGKRKNKKQVKELLKKLGLEGYENRKISELSGGQKQRVCIARILIKNPKVLFADEPTGALDSKTGKEVMNLLKEISEEILVVFVTHNREYALEYANRMIEIEDGKIVNDNGKPCENEIGIYKEKRAKLSLFEAFKLGAKFLFHRKVKLFLSILLLFITSMLLNIAYVAYSYDQNKNHLELLKTDKEKTIEIRKTKGSMQTKDIAILKKRVGNSVGTIYTNQMNNTFISLFHNESIPQRGNGLFEEDLDELEFIEIENFSFVENLIGEIPVSQQEVIISTALADKMMKYGVYDSIGHIQFPKKYEDFLNKTYAFSGDTMQVTGIIKENGDKIYVKGDFISSLQGQTRIGLDTSNQYIFKLPYVKKILQNNDSIHEKIEYYNGIEWKETSTLKENQVILNIVELFPDKLTYLEEIEKYIQRNSFQDLFEAEKQFIEQMDLEQYIGIKGDFSIYENLEIYIDGQNIKPSKQYEVEVIGVTGFSYFNNQHTLFSKNILSSYDTFTYQKVGVLEHIEDIDVKKLGENYTIYSHYLNDLNIYSNWILEHRFLMIFLFYMILLFTGLFFAYFLFTYIMDAKRQIGILKALGVEDKDIIKMFYIVLVILILFITLMTIFFSQPLFTIMNTYYRKKVESSINPFYMGKESSSFLFLFYFGLSILLGIIPILRITRMKPIHVINKNI